MLALALHAGAPTETYDRPENPVQRAVLRSVSHFSGVREGDIPLGVDGCGVPVFALPVRAMALMYARLVAPPEEFDEAERSACRRIVRAVTEHPEMVGGTRERFDTELMRACAGRLVSKVGAEGVYTAGLLPCGRWPRGLGLAFKIEDGEDHRARPVVAVEALRQLGVLEGEALSAAAPYASFVVNNRRGEAVGEVRASFALERS
jgi:L-asparaginase II